MPNLGHQNQNSQCSVRYYSIFFDVKVLNSPYTRRDDLLSFERCLPANIDLGQFC